jgi:hypothetical protein
MTAWLQPGSAERLPELVHVLRKPFDLSDLGAVLKRYLPRR